MSRMSAPNYSAMSRRAASNADHTSPLRKIVAQGYNVDPERPYQPRLELECGHYVAYPRGAWGDEYSTGTRRRCAKCAAGT